MVVIDAISRLLRGSCELPVSSYCRRWAAVIGIDSARPVLVRKLRIEFQVPVIERDSNILKHPKIDAGIRILAAHRPVLARSFPRWPFDSPQGGLRNREPGPEGLFLFVRK